ncbi:MAG: CRISPR system precrRNA processing endoribonuclease RAMP protein Cas6 [Candidatus Muiribacteriota bacterium]
MLTGKYKFQIKFNEDALLPLFKGSTFRGVFGHALKKSVCALKFQSCENCILNSNCLYPFVFEKKLNNSTNNISSDPHPIVIVPPETKKKEFIKGEILETEVILFGKTNEKLPYFILTFQNMGAMGIGKKIKGRRSRFQLEKVTSGENIIFDGKSNAFSDNTTSQYLELNKCNHNSNCSEIKIKYNTPLRINFDKKIPKNLPFKDLTRIMLRRVSSLMNAYGDGEPELDYKRLIEKAEQIKIKNSDLFWHDMKRYSNRQKKEMYMGGFLGEITYSGNLSEYIPLIDACSKIHIGKNTMFGLGRFDYQLVKVSGYDF